MLLLPSQNRQLPSEPARRSLLAFMAAMLVVLTCRAGSGLPPDIQQSLHRQGFSPDQIGVVVMSPRDGRIRMDHFGHRARSPASTLKLLTTLSALESLGPDFVWTTQLQSTGTLEQGVLHGSVYLHGGAEPDFSWVKLGLMLRQLRDQGVHDIDGDLVVDRSYFSPSRLDLYQPPFDSTPAQYYNVIPDAMLVNSNSIELHLDSTGNQIAIGFLPPLEGVRIRSELVLNGDNCSDWDEEWPAPDQLVDGNQLTIVLQGTFPLHCVNGTSSNILDRNQFIERLVRGLWHELGGQWHGQVRDGVTPSDASVLVEHKSAALADIIKIINKNSDNTMARNLFLTLGAQSVQRGSQIDSIATLDAAQKQVRHWLLQHRIDDAGLVLENGSGLSRLERISPIQLANILKAGTDSPWQPEFVSSLPIMGMDGTMAKRNAKDITPGGARIKGGTLNNTVAVAGYVQDIMGETWIVVAMINRPDAGAGRAVLDDLIAWIAGHPEKSGHK